LTFLSMFPVERFFAPAFLPFGVIARISTARRDPYLGKSFFASRDTLAFHRHPCHFSSFPFDFSQTPQLNCPLFFFQKTCFFASWCSCSVQTKFFRGSVLSWVRPMLLTVWIVVSVPPCTLTPFSLFFSFLRNPLFLPGGFLPS